MAWPFKEKKEGEVEKTPEQIKAEQDAIVARFSEALDAKLSPVMEKVSNMENRWNAIEAEANKPPADPNAEPPKPLNDNEQKLFAATVLTNARLTEREVIDELSSDWKDLIPEARKIFADTPVNRKAQPDYAAYCRNVVDMLIGREAKKHGLRSEGGKFFLEDAGTGGEHGDPVNTELRDYNWQDPVSGKTLTGRQQLEKLGIDPKKFVEANLKGAN